MSIEQVVARARQGGGFSQRRTFTMARGAAIRKMREFALADPYYYVLELIQAAVANGAEYLDIRCSTDDISLSWIGGGFIEEQLAQLFDFLFASKQRLEFADARQLALGVNALMHFEPTTVAIESGFGELSTSARVEINAGSEQLSIGKPDHPINGTFIYATGFKKRKRRRSGMLPEVSAIESRCLTSPIPLLVNGNALFGYRTTRSPDILGFAKWLRLDEGDLYGSLGMLPPGEEAQRNLNLKLLTFGVWVESVPPIRLAGNLVGGVICFDRLSKTADHNAIVKDAHYEELLSRLRPYAGRLVSGDRGQKEQSFRVEQGTTGIDLTPSEMRELLRENSRIVAVPSAERPKGSNRVFEDRGRLVATMLGCPMVTAHPSQLAAIPVLSGGGCSVLSVDGLCELDRAFLRQKPLDAHSESDVLAREAGAARTWNELLGTVGIAADLTDFARLVGNQPIISHVTANATRADVDRGGLLRIQLLDRSLWERDLEDVAPGLVVDVTLPDLLPSPVTKAVGEGNRDGLFELLRQHAQPAIDRVVSLLLASMDGHIAPDSIRARLLLQELSRVAFLRLRAANDDTPPELELSLLGGPELPGALEAPLLNTVGGIPRSLNQVCRSLRLTGGIVYLTKRGSTHHETPSVLRAGSHTQACLTSLFGAGAVRNIDDWANAAVPIANGLPNGATLATPGLLARWRQAEQPAVREESARHLLRAAVRGDEAAAQLMLIHDAENRAMSVNALMDAMADDQVEMLEGRAQPLLPDTGAGATVRAPGALARSARVALPMNPFLFYALQPDGHPFGRIHDGVPDQPDPGQPRTFFVKRTIERPTFSGVVGLAATGDNPRRVTLIAQGGERVRALSSCSHQLSGYLRAQGNHEPSPYDLARDLKSAAADVVRELAERVPRLKEGTAATGRILGFLLDVVDENVVIVPNPGEHAELFFAEPDLRPAFSAPLFPAANGPGVSAERILLEYCANGCVDPFQRLSDGRLSSPFGTTLAADLPDPLLAWLQRRMQPLLVVTAAPSSRVTVDAPGLWEVRLAKHLGDCLTRLGGTADRLLDPTTGLSLFTVRFHRAPIPALDRPDGGNEPIRYYARRHHLVIHAQHELAQRALSDETAADADIAWLLIGMYDTVQAHDWEGALVDERVFQARLLSELGDGRLALPE